MAGGGEGKMKVKKAMVAIDESECSYYALEWALANLRDSFSASSPPLVVYNVQPLANVSYLAAASFGAAPPELIQSIQQQQKNIALALLEKAKERCEREGVTVETITEVAEPKEAICEAVEKLGIDLLVMGSHGRGVIQRTFLGSVSNYCVQNAKCPVLVVKKKP